MTNADPALKPSNFRVMELLHTYGTLTAAQLIRLGVATRPDSMRRILRRFAGTPKYVDFLEYGPFPGKGRLPRFYYLTDRGTAYLAAAWRVEPEEIAYPKTAPTFCWDYFHHRATVDFEIEVRLFTEHAGAEVEFYYNYFQTTGANRSAEPTERLQQLTRLPLGDRHFVPDGLFALQAPDDSRFLYLVEIYNGRDTKRVVSKLKKHAFALEEGRVSDLYQYEHAHRVLCVFETEAALRAVTKRLRADPFFTEPVLRQFAFCTLAALRQDFVRGWEFFGEDRVCIFDA